MTNDLCPNKGLVGTGHDPCFMLKQSWKRTNTVSVCGSRRIRWWKTHLTLLFTVDVAYTKIYEAKNSDIAHVSEQSSICYDQKLGWCMTKTAPHEHEQQSDKGKTTWPLQSLPLLTGYYPAISITVFYWVVGFICATVLILVWTLELLVISNLHNGCSVSFAVMY